jgi:hypothetical protein
VVQFGSGESQAIPLPQIFQHTAKKSLDINLLVITLQLVGPPPLKYDSTQGAGSVRGVDALMM